jgi:glycosyltransferase involved in cell wall biosynthesis
LCRSRSRQGLRGSRFVTCLCLTKDRRSWLPAAIRCFEAQSYANRELLILADGADVRDLLPANDSIRLIHLAEARQIGSKRNFGCARAAGELICHWDDDDYSAPERLAEQVGILVEQPQYSVTGYHSMRFTDGPNWFLYSGMSNYALGTSLCYRRSWWERNPFAAVQVGEDNQFVAAAWTAKVLHTVEAGERMYATIHDENTSPRTMGSSWTKIS